MHQEISVELDDHLSSFVSKTLETGRFSSANEAVEAGLTLLMHEEQKRDALIAALIEGEQSGDAQPFDIEEIIREAKSTLRRAA